MSVVAVSITQQPGASHKLRLHQLRAALLLLLLLQRVGQSNYTRQGTQLHNQGFQLLLLPLLLLPKLLLVRQQMAGVPNRAASLLRAAACLMLCSARGHFMCIMVLHCGCCLTSVWLDLGWSSDVVKLIRYDGSAVVSVTLQPGKQS
jgi:O-antigen ligase